jgi:predicted DNA-binding transcriptional regulator YafY
MDMAHSGAEASIFTIVAATLSILGSVHASTSETAPGPTRRPAAACYVRERVCHPTQQFKDLAGGRLEMTLRVNHLLEVKRWVMSFGPDCEVLEPEQLRSEVAAELLQAVRQYGRV